MATFSRGFLGDATLHECEARSTSKQIQLLWLSRLDFTRPWGQGFKLYVAFDLLMQRASEVGSKPLVRRVSKHERLDSILDPARKFRRPLVNPGEVPLLVIATDETENRMRSNHCPVDRQLGFAPL